MNEARTAVTERPGGEHRSWFTTRAAASYRWYPVLLFLAVATVLYVLVALSLTSFAEWYTFHEGEAPEAEWYYGGPAWLGGWARFDAGWYRSIADNGYFFKGTTEQSSVAFFPLYPLLTRWLSHGIGGDPSAWGILITFLSGFGATMLFWHWLRARFDAKTARISFAVLAVWPYAFYLYGAVYADALFVFLVLAAFVSIDHDRIGLATLCGALATATRPVGIAVVVGLTARVLEQRGVVTLGLFDRAQASRRALEVRLRSLRWRDPVILLSVTGLVVYMVYLWRTFDDPFAFATAEAAPGWDQRPSPKVWFKGAWFSRLINLPDSGVRYFGLVTIQGVLVLGLLLLVPRVARRLGWAYALYTLALLAFPLIGSKDFQGIGRYALGAFPAFAVFGEVLAARPAARRVWFGGAFVALCFFAASFGRGGYVA